MSRSDAGAIGAILPLRVRGRRTEVIPRCRILLASLAAFTEPGLFDEIHVVAPARDRPEVERLCTEWRSLPLTVLDEDAYLPTLGQHRFVAGWFRQQAIKLRAAERLQARFFITLDDDVILCKPLKRADLIVGGRALLEPNPRTAHPDWWTGAAQLLGVPIDLSRPGMFVTPAILARPVCLRLFDHLERRHERAWSDALLHQAKRPWLPRWSEYALYYLAGEAAGMLAEFHAIAGTDTPQRLWCPSHVWRRSDLDHWNVAECFDQTAPGFFTVVQSNLDVSAAEVMSRIGPYLKL